jgi:hypothetical protein
MLRSNKNLVIILLGLGAVAAAACSKTGSAPTGFGVNVIVDGSKLSADQRKSLTTDLLTVTSDKTGDTPVTKTLPDLPKALQSGQARFHYTPGSGITASNKLTLEIEVMAGSTLVAGGSKTVQLATNAVDATIVLIPGSGTNNDGGGGSGGADGGGGSGGGGGGFDANPGDIVNPGGHANGVACGADSECGTGFCTDGVCCNERCNDTCAACNVATSKGFCTAYAADTDPEFECSPSPDAGTTTDAGSTEAGGSDASATDADQSDAPVINLPDGGLMTMPRSCASTCDGAKKCRFPDTTKSCGKSFCNTSGEIASFVCDGKGGCGPALSECQDYKCVDSMSGGACGTTCTTTADCLSTSFCDGTKKCTTKKGNGVPCVTPDECSTGHCIAGATGGVCCNTACDSPLTCTMAGAVGQCKCSECPNGTCQVFYPDTDGDGYGDRTATYAAHTAKAACTGAPPAGFVADNTDCDDGDSNVHPGQTTFFPTKSRAGAGTFDYDCDGVLTKKTPEYINGKCQFCGSTDACSLVSATCLNANQASSFQCPLEYTGIIKADEPLSTNGPLITPVGVPGDLAPRAAGVIVPPPIIIIRPQCCGCYANDRTGFLGTVQCGATANTYTCNPCAAAGQGPAPATPTSTVQNCR